MFFVYILKCRDGSLYTGWTNDVKKRVQTHNQGKGAKYTRARLPAELLFYREFPSKEEAMRAEYRIKRLKREDKVRIVEDSKYSEAFFRKLGDLQ